MELRQLRYFLMVAEERHFGRAARRLNIVQPALSMQIRALETALGGALFERTSRRVDLTEIGALFLPEAQLAVAQAARAEEAVRRSLRGEVGLIRIGFFSNAAFSGRLQADVAAFRDRFPGVTVELIELNTVAQVAALKAGTIDLGYCTIVGETPGGVAVHPIARFPWYVALAESHPLAGATAITAAQVRQQDLILYAGGPLESGQLRTMRTLLGEQPRIAVTAGTSLAVLASAASGLGIALVPEPLATIGMAGLVFRPIAELVEPAELHLIVREGPMSSHVAAFLAGSANNGE